MTYIAQYRTSKVLIAILLCFGFNSLGHVFTSTQAQAKKIQKKTSRKDQLILIA